ncbi:hypothetical protein TNIN_253611 [Trichonephila inaurata madagascariensis]|uniref:Uncharacterized protein n=1 Tax=Trichonephila inaurata madagascariensis TaxID=2747483 RepID=A0A8X7CQN0_9ARAC|nr:hypothetical protein TNIN_253611 [Trichonephila inaurata madagascariensis]
MMQDNSLQNNECVKNSYKVLTNLTIGFYHFIYGRFLSEDTIKGFIFDGKSFFKERLALLTDPPYLLMHQLLQTKPRQRSVG